MFDKQRRDCEFYGWHYKDQNGMFYGIRKKRIFSDPFKLFYYIHTLKNDRNNGVYIEFYGKT